MKLSLIPVLLFSLFTFSNLYAQKYENDLKLGLGIIHYPSPNASALAFYGGFSRPFFPKSIVEISAAAALPVDYVTTTEERKLSSYHFGMNLYFNLIDQRKQNFRIGLGFTAGIFDTDWKVTATGLMGTDHVFQPGLAILMEYNLIFNQRFILGVLAKGLLYGDDKSAFFGGLHGGFRF
jgi:hypothetical protein